MILRKTTKHFLYSEQYCIGKKFFDKKITSKLHYKLLFHRNYTTNYFFIVIRIFVAQISIYVGDGSDGINFSTLEWKTLISC